MRFDPRAFEFHSEETLYADPTHYKHTRNASTSVFPRLIIGTNASELAAYCGAPATMRSYNPSDRFSLSAVTKTDDAICWWTA
jgi:hypothetical protein